MNPRKLLFAAFAALALLWGPALAAQGWSGTLGIAVLERSVSGNEDSFRSQLNLDDGLTLEELDLQLRSEDDEGTELHLRASGIGGTEPSQNLEFDLDLQKPWRFELGYDRRESFFALSEYEQGRRTDDWDVERWRAGVAWEGWKAAKLRFDYRNHRRQGQVERPVLGLNELYTLHTDLNESMEEVAFTLETRGLLLFEQSFATYERRSDRRPASSTNLDGDDADFFAVAEGGREEREVPTSRLVISYASPRWEVLGSLLYSPVELDGGGAPSEGFDLLGGRVGRVEFIDDVVSSADMDSLVGNLRLGIRLAPRWVLRFESDHRDTSTDATLLGARIVRITNPFGNVFDLAGGIDRSTVFDVTDDRSRLTVEWSGEGGATAWSGGFIASRDVRWPRSEGDPTTDVTRDSDGYLAGVSWSRGKVSGSAEYEHGTFDRFVFRTDPKTVDRFTLRLKAALAERWHLRAQERVRGRQPVGDRRSRSLVGGLGGRAGVGWSSEDGKRGFGLDLDWTDLATETDLVLPDGSADVSVYDLALFTLSLHGRAEVGKLRLSGSASRLDDSGETWPVESWIARARIGFLVRAGLEVAALGEYYSYDEGLAAGDDFDVTRYGLGLRWSLR